jgi:hypothetical protein
VKGSVPGSKGRDVLVRSAIKGQRTVVKQQPAKAQAAAAKPQQAAAKPAAKPQPAAKG